MTLSPGGNTAVPAQELRVKIVSGAPVDASSYRLYADNHVRGDADMCFYGQPRNDDNTVSVVSDASTTTFTVSLDRLTADVQKIAFAVTCESPAKVANLGRLEIQVEHAGQRCAEGVVDVVGREEAALILGEFYRRNGEWKFRFIAQGFNGGLKPLAEYYGVVIADEPAHTSSAASTLSSVQAANKSTVNLSKVSLTKEKPAISLAKQDNFGQIRINLNWHRTSKPGGLFSFGNKDIDLDLGAFVELKGGEKGVIQALGNAFGDYRSAPFVELQGDDRTGDNSSGEWLHINGEMWQSLREVLVYAFIYKGVPSWDKTDGVVTIHIPNQPPIETRLTEGNNRRTLCAVARLVNDNGAIKVERINQFFSSQREMDEAFNWGFRWTAGSK